MTIKGLTATHTFSAEDVPFLNIGGRELLARIHRPAGDGPFPALVDVHGGHFVNGNHESNAYLAEQFAGAGVLVVTPGFRVPPEVIYPGSVADVNYCVRWLKANAAKYGTRPEMIGGIGTSSGGHPLMMVAMRPEDPNFTTSALPGGFDAKVAFAILCYPVVDPLARYAWAIETNRDELLHGHDAYFASEEEQGQANPTRLLERGEAIELPPVLCLSGRDDRNVPVPIIERFAAAYRNVGGSIEYEIYENTPHGYMTEKNHGDATQDTLERSLEFIHKNAAAN